MSCIYEMIIPSVPKNDKGKIRLCSADCLPLRESVSTADIPSFHRRPVQIRFENPLTFPWREVNACGGFCEPTAWIICCVVICIFTFTIRKEFRDTAA